MRESDFEEGYKTALKDVHSHLLKTYQTAFTWDDINEALRELGFTGGD